MPPKSPHFVLVVSFILLSGCDSSDSGKGPSISGISQDQDLVLFHPSESLPVVTLRLQLDGDFEESRRYKWTASSGQFVTSGSSQVIRKGNELTVQWTPKPDAGESTITVQEISSQESESVSTMITVQPRSWGVWSGAVDLPSGIANKAGLCIFMSSAEQFEQYHYIEVGTSFVDGTGGGFISEQNYLYPNLTSVLTEADSDSSDEPLNLAGAINSRGTEFDIELTLESGSKRIFNLERTFVGCSHDTLADYVRSH